MSLGPIAGLFSNDGETIIAIATPPGRGAIAVIRVSGENAHDIVRRHLREWPAAARQATLCTVVDRSDAVLDRALVTAFAAPRSFTGENMVEIATHGGGVVPALVMAALVSSGARYARPGEFTRRAVLNGKLDLVQAEAIGDLVDASSRAMHAAAIQQLDGGLSRRIAELREQVIAVETLIAYDIDFPEEDDGPIPRERVTANVRELLGALDALLATAPVGELVRTGAVVVIAGPPNTGKSSLFNALLGSNRAIVTDIPGTTRDAIEAVIDVGKWPVRLVDTAGLRETDDAVERIGIEVSTRYLAAADVVLACDETETGIWTIVRAITASIRAPVIGVLTKSDTGKYVQGKINKAPETTSGGTAGGSRDTSDILDDGGSGGTLIPVSARTGEGITPLLDAIAETLATQHGALPLDAPVLTRERHRYAIGVARDELVTFERGWNDHGLPASVAAVHLRAAVHALEELIGAIDVEDVLDRLFGTFCIGK